MIFHPGDLYSPEEAEKEGKEPDWVATERESFKTFRDKNDDGFLDRAEVKQWILPDHYDHSEAEAKHLIHEADADKVRDDM